MQEPVWLTRHIIDAIYADQIRLHGGASGVRKLDCQPDSSLAAWVASHMRG